MLKPLAAAAISAGLLATPTPALPADGPGGTSWTFKFSSKRTAKPVGTFSRIEPAIRDDKGTVDESDDTFAAATKSVIRFPKRSRVDTRVPRRCKATPSEIGSGRERCGRKTRIGGGAAVSLVGVTPFNATIDAYNQAKQIVFVVQPCAPGTGPTTGNRCAPAGAIIVLVGRWRKPMRAPRLIVRTPASLLAFGITITRFELETEKITKRVRVKREHGTGTRTVRRSFVTTPPRCRGRWTSSATESYADAPTLTIKDRQRCRRR